MDTEHILELFAAFGRVSVRRLFGGFGIYLDGTMFALAARGVIYLKADDESAKAYEREGQGPFTYGAKGGQRVVMSYWRLPDRLYDDPDELAAWARVALAVARRSKEPKAGRKMSRMSKPGRKTANKSATKPKRRH
jgi:DNA transformation protein and related proteins